MLSVANATAAARDLLRRASSVSSCSSLLPGDWEEEAACEAKLVPWDLSLEVLLPRDFSAEASLETLEAVAEPQREAARRSSCVTLCELPLTSHCSWMQQG